MEYVHPDDTASALPQHRTWMPAYAGAWWAAATIVTVTRFRLRTTGRGMKLGWDDAMLLPAWIFGTLLTATLILQATYGQADRYLADIDEDRLETWGFVAFLLQFFNVLSSSLTKLSVLSFCRRTFKGINTRHWDYAFLAGIGFTIAYTVWLVIILFVVCRPVQANWKLLTHPEEYKDACLPLRPAIIIFCVFAACTSLSDLYTVLVSCLATRKLLLQKRHRIALSIIFSLGLLIFAASVIRNYYMLKWSYNPTDTRSWTSLNANVWWQLEIQLGIICASAPALKSLFVVVSSPRGSARSSSSRRNFSIEVMDEVTITTEAKSAASRDPYDLGFLDNQDTYTVEARATRGNLRPDHGQAKDQGGGVKEPGQRVQ